MFLHLCLSAKSKLHLKCNNCNRGSWAWSQPGVCDLSAEIRKSTSMLCCFSTSWSPSSTFQQSSQYKSVQTWWELVKISLSSQKSSVFLDVLFCRAKGRIKSLPFQIGQSTAHSPIWLRSRPCTLGSNPATSYTSSTHSSCLLWSWSDCLAQVQGKWLGPHRIKPNQHLAATCTHTFKAGWSRRTYIPKAYLHSSKMPCHRVRGSGKFRSRPLLPRPSLDWAFLHRPTHGWVETDGDASI